MVSWRFVTRRAEIALTILEKSWLIPLGAGESPACEDVLSGCAGIFIRYVRIFADRGRPAIVTHVLPVLRPNFLRGQWRTRTLAPLGGLRHASVRSLLSRALSDPPFRPLRPVVPRRCGLVWS
jgi:hypothetical protein